MKKISIAAASMFLFFTASAQSEKKKPPPPPPPPNTLIEERVKVQKVDGIIVKEPPVVTVKGKLAGEFYKRNATVGEISRQGNVITLNMKDGTIEKYDMNKKEDDKSFTEKYGVSPIPPPPPPPKVVEEKKRS